MRLATVYILLQVGQRAEKLVSRATRTSLVHFWCLLFRSGLARLVNADDIPDENLHIMTGYLAVFGCVLRCGYL